jgi:hypothetical protein
VNKLLAALNKIVNTLEEEQMAYMLVGGFAVSFYNRVRFTLDIDLIIQIHVHHIDKIIAHFPDWAGQLEGLKDSATKLKFFNIIDFETGIKLDFMLYQDSDYNWTAFERRRKVDFMGIECYIAAVEDLIIGKLLWYAASKSEKQLGDIQYLLTVSNLNHDYLNIWCNRLLINRYGLF